LIAAKPKGFLVANSPLLHGAVPPRPTPPSRPEKNAEKTNENVFLDQSGPFKTSKLLL
jgi:hypothetical protein